MIKKMCFSCKGLRRCEAYEQNSEASIWRRSVYSTIVSSSFCLVRYTCVRLCMYCCETNIVSQHIGPDCRCVYPSDFCLSFSLTDGCCLLTDWVLLLLLLLSALSVFCWCGALRFVCFFSLFLCFFFGFGVCVRFALLPVAMCVFGSRYNAQYYCYYLPCIVNRSQLAPKIHCNEFACVCSCVRADVQYYC